MVYARERGGTWTTIAEALDTTAERARDRYTGTVDRWEAALHRPWEHSGRFLTSRMPDGTIQPDETAADLDQCAYASRGDHQPCRPADGTN